jgi:DNA-binding CsgD family transcriptional regulator
LIDEGGRLIEANACVRFGDGLQLAQGRLHAPRAADRKRLREFLAAMVRPDRSSDEYAPTLALPRPSGLRPWLLAHIDCRKISRGRARPAAILLLITDVEAPARLPRGLLMQVFGLTVTEAQLARELATGMALQEASLQLGISEGHARQRLKKIFDKTGTSRQGELIALLTRLS